MAHTDRVVTPALKVRPICMFEDNYAWRVDNVAKQLSFVVDPASAPTVLRTYEDEEEPPELAAILCTHFHQRMGGISKVFEVTPGGRPVMIRIRVRACSDHAGGNEEMVRQRKGIAVIGGAEEGERVPAMTRGVRDGETLDVAGVPVRVLFTPCHTRGHVSYYVDADPDHPPMVFTGDTLFGGGVGRFFEGDAPTMARSLAKLTALPRNTLIYCGHEYTAANLRFCAHVEPENAALQARIKRVAELRAAGKPTVPSTLEEELATNVFLRTSEPAVQRFTHGTSGSQIDSVEVLHRLREAKNGFK